MKKRMMLLGILLAGGIAVGSTVLERTENMKLQDGVSAGVTADMTELMAEQNDRVSTRTMSEEVLETVEQADAEKAMQMEEDVEMGTELAETAIHEVPMVASEYADIAIAQVSNYVNVRALPDTESEVLGKLYDDSAATVLEATENGWYRISSGSVEGYVKAEYVVVGDEALARAVGTRLATVTTTTLFVRSEPTTEAAVLTMVPEGDDLLVINEPENGWVQVATVEGDGYVSADYVNLTTEYIHAESKAEEEARLAREEAERQAAAKAAEEARRAREEEVRRQQSASQSRPSGGNSASGGSTGSTSGNASGSGSIGTSDSLSGGSAENTDSSSSGSGSTGNVGNIGNVGNTGNSSSSSVSNGQAVVDYGMQFLGNPYVFGGTSLTNGIDCSAFVQQIYAAFGVSLPRNSAAQRSAGYAVSVEQIQAGDIVCYSGHVGIYAGNNTLLHASNEKTGITLTSPITYRKILAVRRIF